MELVETQRLPQLEHVGDATQFAARMHAMIGQAPLFEQFNLADYVQVRSAAFENGLLKIELIREIPEAMKPRRIAIHGAPSSTVHQLEGKAA